MAVFNKKLLVLIGALVLSACGSSAGPDPTSVIPIGGGAIGGGIPSGGHFDLLVARENLPGLVTGNFHTTFTVLLADRLGNYNMLTGTSVSFFTEAGAIAASSVVDTTGVATVDFRTQGPPPATVSPTVAENTLIKRMGDDYGITTTNFPRLGWVTVLATVRGEEGFIDNNANGIFDAGDSVTGPGFNFDLGEAFLDVDDNDKWESPELFFNDAGGTAGYDGLNGVWDGPGCTQAGCRTSPTIWASHTIMFTGNITYCAATNVTTPITPTPTVPVTFNVADGKTETIRFMVSDINLNRPVPGTKITATISSAGVLVGPTTYTVLDGIGGPFEVSFTIGDAVVGDNPVTPLPAQLTITVVAGNNEVLTCPQTVVNGTIK